MLGLIQTIIMPTIAMIWASVYFLEVMQLSEKNQYLIRPVFFIMVVLYVINTLGDVKKWKETQAEREKLLAESEGEECPKEIELARIANKERKEDLIQLAMILGVSLIYLLIMPRLGFIISTILFLFAQLIVLKADKGPMLIVLPLVLTVVLHLAFTKILGIPLPVGILRFTGVF